MKKLLALSALLLLSVALLGCAQPEQQPSKPLVVCALFDPRVPVFKADAEAIRLAVEEINTKGGIMGRQLTYIHEDTQRKVDIAVTAYRSAVLEKGCSIVFVEGVSEEVMAIIEEGAKIYSTNPHIVISSQAGVETTFKVIENYDKYKFYFRNLPPDPNLNYEVARWFFDIAKNVVGAKKVALLLEDAAWTKCAREGCLYESKFGKFESKAMKDWVRDEYGLEVVYVAHIAVGESNFLPMLETAAKNGAEYIFVLSSWYTNTVTLTKQWAASAARDIPLAFFGGPAQWIRAWNLTGGDNLGTIAMIYDYEALPPISPLTQNLVKKMHDLGLSVDTSVSYYYSEVYRIKEAMEKAKTTENIDAVIKAMEELNFTNHATIVPKFNYFGYRNANFHSYTGGPTLNAQIQCNGTPVYIMRPEVILEAGFPKPVADAMNPAAYKPPAELRKICGKT
ncbi:MAG: ABC transporter substrate-binding protein [Archaeoglobales archaeon]|nr:ABC transporter substrate-binding protein [Archaeoglobales archaeon]